MKSSFQIRETTIPGFLEIEAPRQEDERGRFVKLYHESGFPQQCRLHPLAEEYCNFSHRRVLRGLHFQLPPMDVTKLVTCLVGEVMDVVVDLRVGSPTYRQYETKVLSEARSNMLFIPSGLAHGFYVTSETALLLYKVNKAYSPECDSGIHWASVPIPWMDSQPILSSRDKLLEPFEEFESPFRYESTNT